MSKLLKVVGKRGVLKQQSGANDHYYDWLELDGMKLTNMLSAKLCNDHDIWNGVFGDGIQARVTIEFYEEKEK